MSLPGWVPLVLTALYPAALGAAAAAVSRALVPLLDGGAPPEP
jgi:hypothetical protein